MIDEHGDLGLCKNDADLVDGILARCVVEARRYGKSELSRLVAKSFLEIQKSAHDPAGVMELVLDVLFGSDWLQRKLEGPQHVMH